MTLPKSLSDGYRRYQAGLASQRGRQEQLAELGQTPLALVVTCCDARVLPQEIFDAEPGALFIVRNVANLVPPYEIGGGFHGTSAAIEYAVLSLRVPHVIVLGHSRCGGIMALRKGVQQPEAEGHHIARWMSMLAEAMQATQRLQEGPAQAALELAAVQISMRNLRSFAPLAERESGGRLTLSGLHYDIATGALTVLDEATGSLVPLDHDRS